MSKPIFVYDDNTRLKDAPSTTELLNCIVQPTDGSYSVMLRNGKLVYSGCINDHKYRVIAERGQFPTDSDHDNGRINDIMMVRVDDPTIVVFCQSRFLKTISSPKPSTEQIVDKLRQVCPDVQWCWQHKNIWFIVNAEQNKFPIFDMLTTLNSINKIDVMFETISGTSNLKISIQSKDWYNLLNY